MAKVCKPERNPALAPVEEGRKSRQTNSTTNSTSSFRTVHPEELAVLPAKPVIPIAGPLFQSKLAMMLVGPSGLGKSMLCLETGMEIAAGWSGLGLAVGKGLPSLYFCLEDPQVYVGERFRAYLECFPSEAQTRIHENFSLRFPTGATPSVGAVMQAIEAWAIHNNTEERGGGFVVIDTLQAVSAGDENTTEAAHALWTPIMAACQTHGLTVVLVHHLRKAAIGEPGGGRTHDRVRGASAHLAFSRALVVMEPHPASNGQKLAKLTLSQNKTGSAGASLVLAQDPVSGLWRPATTRSAPDLSCPSPVTTSAPRSSAGQLTEARHKVLRFLRDSPDTSRESMACHMYGTSDSRSADRLRSQLRHLRGENLIDTADKLTTLGIQALQQYESETLTAD